MAHVVIVGSTGYTGMMLLRILLQHPSIERITPISRSQAGKPVRELDPGLGPDLEQKIPGGTFVAHDELPSLKPDAIISALPHGAAAEVLVPLAGIAPIIDLSADFRLQSPERYEAAYGKPHAAPQLLEQAVYGLCETNREQIRGADIIANPGCYPTATLLPLLPFATRIAGPVIVNAMSGISGAGRKEATNLLFCERSENANAYSPGRTHRHVPEIEEQLTAGGLGAGASTPGGAKPPGGAATAGRGSLPAGGASTPGSASSPRRAATPGDAGNTGRAQPQALYFTPHLVPIKQGMVVTSIAELTAPLSLDEARTLISSTYEGSPFVGLSARGIPETRDVRNTNRCDIGVVVLGERRIELFSTIDNLYKGASGQAVQNLNIRLGFDERSGLRTHGEF